MSVKGCPVGLAYTGYSLTVLELCMQSTLLSHALAVEFPELADAVHRLKADNAHFTRLLAEHDAIDQKVARDEQKIEVLNDETLHELKQQRLKLKDELYRMATQAE